MSANTKNIIEKVEICNFNCEAGPLSLCVDWETLKTKVDLWVVVKVWAGAESVVMNTTGNGGWRFTVHTNKAEAEATAASINREHYGRNSICQARRWIDVKDKP